MGTQGLEAGEEVGGYRLIEPIAEGGMAIVWRAQHIALERPAALKIVRADLTADAEFRRRFAAEARAAAAIDHPNVVTVFDAGEDGGNLFLAMALVDGSTLRDLLDRSGPVPVARAVEIVGAIAGGLDATHAAGLVHRDVKPANVLIDQRSGDVRITDFGVVKTQESSTITRSGAMVGTLDYLAPEQIRGDEVDPRTDVYALGCVLYELVAGGVPFPRATAPARMRAHLHDPVPRLSSAAEAPAALDDVVATAMAKAPGERFASAGALGRAALEATRPPAARKPSGPPRTVVILRGSEPPAGAR